jgi:type I restriction enzyme S subunit
MIRVVKKGGKLALAPKHLALVRTVLRTHAPHHRAYVFGSRVVLNAADRARLKPHSDLDLVLEGPPLKPHLAYALREAFSESDLPMRVDAVAVCDLPKEWEIRAWPL